MVSPSHLGGFGSTNGDKGGVLVTLLSFTLIRVVIIVVANNQDLNERL